jgi:TorA maturation chaperone TorD
MGRGDAGDESRIARQRAYALLGALLVEGVDAARLSVVRALPGLADALPVAAVGEDQGAELDALAAEHQALFGHEVFPFAGVFMGDEGLVGEGTAAGVVRAAHTAVGVVCPAEPNPDHLGQALRLLGVLVDAELEARAHRDADDVRTLEQWQRRVLDEAVLPWMPALWVALPGQPASLWTRAVELAVGVLGEHRSALGGLPLGADSRPDAAPPVEAVLDDPKAGLGAVAQALVTPARSGVYLARRDLETIARRSDLPRGFGSRKSMLERLLRVAAEYQSLPRLLDELRQLLQARDDAYAGLHAEPGLGPYVPAWRRRLAGSVRLVERMAHAAPHVGSDG